MDVALYDHLLAAVGEGQAGRVVSLRGAVDQKPASPSPPGLGGQRLGLLEGRRAGADVDSLDQSRDVMAKPLVSDQAPQGGVGARLALVARDVEAAGIALGVGDQRVEVG